MNRSLRDSTYEEIVAFIFDRYPEDEVDDAFAVWYAGREPPCRLNSVHFAAPPESKRRAPAEAALRSSAFGRFACRFWGDARRSRPGYRGVVREYRRVSRRTPAIGHSGRRGHRCAARNGRFLRAVSANLRSRLGVGPVDRMFATSPD